jgi:hypothetical protein
MIVSSYRETTDRDCKMNFRAGKGNEGNEPPARVYLSRVVALN